MSLKIKISKDEPAYKLGKRVRKISWLPPGIRKLTGRSVLKEIEVPKGSIGTVIEICTAYIRIRWDNLGPMPKDFPNDLFWCCYDPVEQMVCIQPLDN
jgi:hypothetical protein